MNIMRKEKINKKSRKKVIIGLSGGVDSAVSAYLLQKKGFEVIGLYMKTFREEIPCNKPCKSIEKISDERMAKLIAKFLKIPLIIVNEKEEYNSKVIKPMIQDYSKGLTPNPDIACNKLIKFPILLKYADKIGADFIATGHYAQIKKNKEKFHLLAGKDKTKDQSYFLYELDQKTLSRILFPVGDLMKEKVREIAKKINLPNWNKPGTRGICFVGKIHLKEFLEKSIKNRPGKILSPEGEILGTHPGTFYFTIGQKIQESLGLNINKPNEHAQERYYIAEKRKSNILIAAPEGHPALLKNKVIISSFHNINPSELIPHSGLTARIRHLGKLHKGILKGKSFTFNKPIEGIAEGQSIVLYKKDKVLGGGEIEIQKY